MPARVHIENDSAQTVVTTAETAVGSFALPPLNQFEPEGANLLPATITGELNFTEGAVGTAVTVRVRHGINSLTGAVIGNPQVETLAAAASADIPFEVYDAVGDASGYTITVQQTAATGNGTVNNISADLDQQ